MAFFKRTLLLVCLALGLILGLWLLTSTTGAEERSSTPYQNAPTRRVVINEVAWAGTQCSANDEWIELYNNTSETIDLTGWVLKAVDGSPIITLQGTIPPFGFFLLERSDDNTVADITADQIFKGYLLDSGEILELRDATGTLVDTANADGGPWPAGQASPERRSMERINPAGPDTDDNWGTNNGFIRNGIDCGNNPITGTPKALNSVSYPDLAVSKRGPDQVVAGESLTYTITITNGGVTGVSNALVTDTLPEGVAFLSQQSPFTFTQPSSNILVWETGPIPGLSGPYFITLTVQSPASGCVTNEVRIATSISETNYLNNVGTMTTCIIPLMAQLKVTLSGPEKVLPGSSFPYTVTLSNQGLLGAEGLVITAELPSVLEFLTHTSPYSLSEPSPNLLVWEANSLGAGEVVSWTIEVKGGERACGNAALTVTVSSLSPEPDLSDNTAHSETSFIPKILLDALLYDGYQTNDADEAFRLWNWSACEVDLGNWCVTDGEGKVCFPAGARLAPGKAIWCAKDALAFQRSFGFLPDWEYGADSSPEVPQMSGKSPAFGNSGDEAFVLPPGGTITDSVDTLVYEGGNANSPGWQGEPVQPYRVSGGLGLVGQVLLRKRDERTGSPLQDTNSRADWIQDPDDPHRGRRVFYPGWNLEGFIAPTGVTETASLTVAIGPDHLYETFSGLLLSAERSLEIATYSLEHISLTLAIAEKASAGVSVTVLLEGEPVGGLSREGKWAAKVISDAGGKVYFMVGYPRRYRFQHAKYAIIDGRLALLGSENLSPNGMPSDPKGDGTVGHRGVYIATDAPSVVEKLRSLFWADANPSRPDVADCSSKPDLCSPPPIYRVYLPLVMRGCSGEGCGGTERPAYRVKFPAPLGLEGSFYFELTTAPENALSQEGGLFKVLSQAGKGDLVLSQQLYEYLQWGDGQNLRLEAMVEAARRGASVRILLDDFYYHDQNSQVVDYLNKLAREERLDLAARLASPMGMGVHNKMVLARIGGQHYVWIGSINGSEVSFKVNREVGLLIRSKEAFDYLASLFWTDWAAPYGVFKVYVPLTFNNFRYPSDLLISEVLYDAPGDDEGKEWVEVYNPTSRAISLGDYKLGDAQERGVREGMYRFPAGSTIGPGEVKVIAWSASGFYGLYGRWPDFELVDTNPNVPDMVPYTSWSSGPWELRNLGDEVVLLGPGDNPVDVVVYGDKSFPGVKAHPGVSKAGASLERYPPNSDTDDCARDFRVALTPTPGSLPER